MENFGNLELLDAPEVRAVAAAAQKARRQIFTAAFIFQLHCNVDCEHVLILFQHSRLRLDVSTSHFVACVENVVCLELVSSAVAIGFDTAEKGSFECSNVTFADCTNSVVHF